MVALIAQQQLRRSTAYASLVLSLGPVGYWRSIVGGIVPDLSGHGHHGALIGNVAPAPGAIHHDADPAMAFDGASRIEIPDHAELDFTGDLTLLCWIKTTQSTSSFPRLIAKEAGVDDRGYQLILNSNQSYTARLEVFCLNNHNHGANALGATINDGRWHMVAATVDGGKPTMYVDGELITQNGAMDAPVRTNDAPLVLGANAEPTAFFVGDMDEIAAWGRALTAVEIRALYLVAVYGG